MSQEQTETSDAATQPAPGPLREIVQPFIDLIRAPRALWGVNLAYLLEGFVYFGMLGYLAMYFNELVGLSDVQASPMVGFLTVGITVAMVVLGGRADKLGTRNALLLALLLMLVGRAVVASGSYLGLGAGMWGPLHLVTMGGLLFVIAGYGLFQPGAYAAVRVLTTEKTAAMGYAMLYALMNLGGWLPSFFSPVRKAVGINGAYVVYTALTVLGLVLTFFILSRRTVERAVAAAKAEREAAGGAAAVKPAPEEKQKEPFSLTRWLRSHPLADVRFTFFIFCLIPVQTLFAHNWLTLPMYVERAFRGTAIGDNFEFAVNLNPLLIFILVPIVAALTRKRNVYNMMILGTLVMAAPTFLLALGPTPWTLIGYLLVMTVGEAMWQPRFLQYAAEIAPEGRTGSYIGVAQIPWFLTKAIVPIYSGWFLENYCPKDGALDTESMWLIYGAIAMCSTLLLVLARGWMTRDFKTKAA
jgi:dipeptide/tripeptide permease